MPVPNLQNPDPYPRQRRATAEYPRIIDQRPSTRDTMLVTFSLPGLRRVTLRVPLDAWLASEHLPAHRAVHALLERTNGPADI